MYRITMVGKTIVDVEIDLGTSNLKEAITDFHKYVKAAREAKNYKGKKTINLVYEGEIVRSVNVGRDSKKNTGKRLFLLGIGD